MASAVRGAPARRHAALGPRISFAAVPHRISWLRLLPERIRADPFFRGLAEFKARRSFACMSGSIARSPIPHSSDLSAPPRNGCSTSAASLPMHGERHPGYLSFVISGARELVERSNEELARSRVDRPARMIPASARSEDAQGAGAQGKACDDGARLPETFRLRPTTATPIPNLFLAGDWMQTGLPATIESAVISGRAAAAAVSNRATETIAAAALTKGCFDGGENLSGDRRQWLSSDATSCAL